jgi:hypothetical protein
MRSQPRSPINSHVACAGRDRELEQARAASAGCSWQLRMRGEHVLALHRVVPTAAAAAAAAALSSA